MSLTAKWSNLYRLRVRASVRVAELENPHTLIAAYHPLAMFHRRRGAACTSAARRRDISELMAFVGRLQRLRARFTGQRGHSVTTDRAWSVLSSDQRVRPADYARSNVSSLCFVRQAQSLANRIIVCRVCGVTGPVSHVRQVSFDLHAGSQSYATDPASRPYHAVYSLSICCDLSLINGRVLNHFGHF